MAEILQVDAKRLEEWEAGLTPIPDPHDLASSLRALANARQSASPACNFVLLDGLSDITELEENDSPSISRRTSHSASSPRRR